MALEPITRQEKIIAGQDLTPITRLEKFLKDFGGGGGGEPDFNVNVVNTSFDEQGVTYLTLDATNEQIGTAYESGKRVFINILGLANAQVQKKSRRAFIRNRFYATGRRSFRAYQTGSLLFGSYEPQMEDEYKLYFYDKRMINSASRR